MKYIREIHPIISIKLGTSSIPQYPQHRYIYL